MLLLLLFSLALITGTALVVFVVRLARHNRLAQTMDLSNSASFFPLANSYYQRRPACWLAVKSHNLLAVQSALGLHNPKPCSWMEGLEQKLFIAPPVKGWVLVIGSGLPDPSDDVDACYRFVLDLSRKLGQVQFFSASRILHHHAWVRADGGRVVRAYAWAGRTIWKQGAITVAEADLDLKCFDYGDPPERVWSGQPDAMVSNTEKVPLLASRWSLDPACIDEQFFENEQGIAGEPSRRY